MDPYVRQWNRFGVIAGRAMASGASQDRAELQAVIGVLSTLAPEVIVELGCDRGGTLYAWRQICPQVYGITLADNADSAEPLATHGASVHPGDTHDPASLDWLRGELSGRPADALVIDAGHTYADASQDLAMYGPLVRPGGLILLHDIRPNLHPLVEVWKLWPQLRRRYATSEISIYPMALGWGLIHVAEGDEF